MDYGIQHYEMQHYGMQQLKGGNNTSVCDRSALDLPMYIVHKGKL